MMGHRRKLQGRLATVINFVGMVGYDQVGCEQWFGGLGAGFATA